MARARTLALVCAAVGLLALPALAHATTYCVAKPSCEAAGGIHEDDLNAALFAAETSGNHDRVEIGPGTFDNVNAESIPNGVDIVGSGSGPGGTLLTRSTTTSTHTTLEITTSTASTVSDLAVQAPNVSNAIGIDTEAQVSNVAVTVPVGAIFSTGVRLRDGGSLSRANVSVPLAANGSLGLLLGDGARASDSSISAPMGASLTGSAVATIERTAIHAYEGIRIEDDELTIDNSLIRVEPGGQGQDGADGIFATVQGGIPPFMHANALTVIGPGTPGSVGITVISQEGIVRDSIVRGFEQSFAISNVGTPPSLLLAYSNYDTSPPADPAVTEQHRVMGDPGFVNAAAGDFHLGAGSPLIDAGDPAGLGSGESATDLAGAPRIQGAAHDVGAYEFQPSAPPQPPVVIDTTRPALTGVRETNRVFAVGRGATPISARKRRVKVGTTFRFTLSEAATVKLAISQAQIGRRVGKRCRKLSRRNRNKRRCHRFAPRGTLTRTGAAGANSIRFTGRIGRRALKPGSYRVKIKATDAAGNVAFPVALTFRVVPGAKKKRR